jgi:hypothetical protein
VAAACREAWVAWEEWITEVIRNKIKTRKAPRKRGFLVY